jgi:hypothetical protein
MTNKWVEPVRRKTARSPKGQYILVVAENLDPYQVDETCFQPRRQAVKDANEYIQDCAADLHTKKELTKGIKVFKITEVEEVDLSERITKAVNEAKEDQKQVKADDLLYEAFPGL